MLLLTSLWTASALGLQAQRHGARAPVRMMAGDASATVLNEVTGNNVKMTDSMRAYVEEKIGATVSRYAPIVTRCDTHLSVMRNPSVADSDSCETVVFAGDVVVRAEERSASMYSSIDMVAAKIGRKLRKLKERREARNRHAQSSIRVPTDLDEDPAVPELPDAAPAVADVIRTKRFPMPKQTLEDAKFCLDALDHEFYVFRSAETGDINVLYKRHEGGLGLIEPEIE